MLSGFCASAAWYSMERMKREGPRLLPGANRRILAVMSSPGLRANVPYTYQEYQYLPNDGRRYEIVEGELYLTPAPSPMHQTVSRRLQFALMKQLEEPGVAFVFDAPFDVILS